MYIIITIIKNNNNMYIYIYICTHFDIHATNKRHKSTKWFNRGWVCEPGRERERAKLNFAIYSKKTTRRGP